MDGLDFFFVGWIGKMWVGSELVMNTLGLYKISFKLQFWLKTQTRFTCSKKKGLPFFHYKTTSLQKIIQDFNFWFRKKVSTESSFIFLHIRQELVSLVSKN